MNSLFPQKSESQSLRVTLSGKLACLTMPLLPACFMPACQPFDAVDGNVDAAEIVVRIDEHRIGFGWLPVFECYQADLANAAQVSVCRFEIQGHKVHDYALP